MILDGGVGTELSHSAKAKDALDEPLWGTRALIESPDAVLRVHREYVQAGCDVISTNTWGLASAVATDGPRLWSDRDTPVHWMDVGRRGLRLARQAVHEARARRRVRGRVLPQRRRRLRRGDRDDQPPRAAVRRRGRAARAGSCP